MAPLVVLGWVAAAAGASLALPQIFRLIRTRATEGISLVTWQLGLGVSLAWLAHGVHLGWANMIAPNAFVAMCQALVLIIIARQRGLALPATFGLALAVAAVGVVLELWSRPEVFALAMVLPLSIGALTQVRDLIRSPSIEGVSGGYLFLQFLVQVLWGSWGAGVGDRALVISATIFGVLSLVQLGWWAGRRVGWIRVRAYAVPAS